MRYNVTEVTTRPCKSPFYWLHESTLNMCILLLTTCVCYFEAWAYRRSVEFGQTIRWYYGKHVNTLLLAKWPKTNCFKLEDMFSLTMFTNAYFITIKISKIHKHMLFCINQVGTGHFLQVRGSWTGNFPKLPKTSKENQQTFCPNNVHIHSTILGNLRLTETRFEIYP